MLAIPLPWIVACFAHTKALPTPGPAQPLRRRLSHGEVMCMRDASDRVIVCDKGCLWLTFDSDPRDVVVQAGQQHRCDRGTPMTIQALADASLRVLPARGA
jgi:hypothetical protein